MGQLLQPREGAVGVAGADVVEDDQDRRVRGLSSLRDAGHPAGAPHRLVLAVGVLDLPLEEPVVLQQLCRDLLGDLMAVVDLDEQQRDPVLRGGGCVGDNEERLSSGFGSDR
ncbi:hypothetical protein [Streptomyces sp. R33]|uniref:Uncharacterized protein n=1 Tax=Streptomyces sp. R33 TaxID=3238629 RepID=A0AB39XWJ8_9ACTN